MNILFANAMCKLLTALNVSGKILITYVIAFLSIS